MKLQEHSLLYSSARRILAAIDVGTTIFDSFVRYHRSHVIGSTKQFEGAEVDGP